MDITVSGEWLIQRSEEEVLKVQSLTMSRIRFMFSSKETIANNEKESSICLGRVKMIEEIIKKNNELLQEQIKNKSLTK